MSFLLCALLALAAQEPSRTESLFDGETLAG
jgi:hypothetical protein